MSVDLAHLPGGGEWTVGIVDFESEKSPKISGKRLCRVSVLRSTPRSGEGGWRSAGKVGVPNCAWSPPGHLSVSSWSPSGFLLISYSPLPSLGNLARIYTRKTYVISVRNLNNSGGTKSVYCCERGDGG